jgi:monofunctional biosynthetic peptidoglycan transglycosylase
MKKFFSILGNLFILGVSGLAILAVLALASLLTLPDVRVLEKCFTTTMYEVHLCPGSNSYVKLKEISPYVLHAVIAAEDGSFYSHQGFDFHEMEESFNADLRTGRIARGGSTLTQQLAKNAFLSKEKSLWRKIKEAYLAMAIERHYTKDFILEKYLNVVEFGSNIYGIKSASEHYFHKPPSELNPLESAYLAFLLPNPKGYSKSFSSGKLTPFGRKMVAIILKRMSSFGKLSPEAYSSAMADIGRFPWTGLSAESFEGAPSYNLDDAKAVPPSEFENDPAMDEDALEEVLKEEDREEAPVVLKSAPPEQPQGEGDSL